MVSSTSSSSHFINADARDYSCDQEIEEVIIQRYHHALPDFRPSPLVPISSPGTSPDLTDARLFFKDESNRIGLPSFKILGASWGAYRALTQKLNLHNDTTVIDISSLAYEARKQGLILSAATDGNHGRAIARMAKVLGIEARIYVPANYVAESTIQNIESEGATTFRSQLDYDGAVMEAHRDSQRPENVQSVVYVQDTAFEGYTEIPSWIVDGYTTMLAEIEAQLGSLHEEIQTPEQGAEETSSCPNLTHVIVPVGVGSLAHAVVKHCKSSRRRAKICVITVEPETAACLNQALHRNSSSVEASSTNNDNNSGIATGPTIMEGMNCATVSTVSWPFLRDGVDLSLTVSDHECHAALLELAALGNTSESSSSADAKTDGQAIKTGPCGAAAYAALKKVLALQKTKLGERFPQIGPESVVVLLGTEGPREYKIPG